MVREGDYEVTPDQWARRRSRKKGAPFPASLEIVAEVDKDTVLDKNRLAFIEQHCDSKWVRSEKQSLQFRAKLDVLVDAVKKVETSEDRWRGMYRLTQALFYADRNWLSMIFRQHVAPCFFKLYPQGKIVVIRHDTAIDEAAAVLRCMYAFGQAPLPNLVQGGFQGVRTLHHWHSGSLLQLIPLLLNLFNYVFYPFVGGVCGGPPGLEFLFLFDPPEQHSLVPFPRNWLALPSNSASFGKESVTSLDVFLTPGSPAHQRGSHQRYQHPKGFDVSERLSFLSWYIERLNRLFYELTDVCNFTIDHDPEAPVDPVFACEHLLTLDRLMRKTLLAMSLDDAPTANLMVFEIADLYDSLSERFGNHVGFTEFFKTLFHPVDGLGLLAPQYATIPSPVGPYLANLAAEVYRRIEEVVGASVWVQSRRSPEGVKVRTKDLSADELKSWPDFVAEVMRAYRNAHHGYFTAGDSRSNRPSRFLFLVDGNLPVEISALPALWWLAYLADPQVMVGWKPLEVGSYGPP